MVSAQDLGVFTVRTLSSMILCAVSSLARWCHLYALAACTAYASQDAASAQCRKTTGFRRADTVGTLTPKGHHPSPCPACQRTLIRSRL